MSDTPDYSRLYQGVIPYIALDDATKAAEFYRQAFGARLHGELVRDEKGVVMNGTMEINGGLIMIMDYMTDMGGRRASEAGHPFTMQIVTDKGQDWFDRAVSAGCTVTMPFAPQFWGDTYGRLKDPFGIEWAINEPSEASMAEAERLAGAASRA